MLTECMSMVVLLWLRPHQDHWWFSETRQDWWLAKNWFWCNQCPGDLVGPHSVCWLCSSDNINKNVLLSPFAVHFDTVHWTPHFYTFIICFTVCSVSQFSMHHCSHLTVFCVSMANVWSVWHSSCCYCINMYLCFMCVCSSDEEKSTASEKYSVTECVELERTGINSSAAACCPKPGSDIYPIQHEMILSDFFFFFSVCLILCVCVCKQWKMSVRCGASQWSFRRHVSRRGSQVSLPLLTIISEFIWAHFKNFVQFCLHLILLELNGIH